MKMRLKILIVSFLLVAAPLAQAGIEAYQFQDPQKEQRFQRLSEELRCLVCQNQNLADSNADLAQDLRSELHRMVQEGATDEEIVQYMVERYGEFVLYRPPVQTTTYLLWFGPFVLLAVGIVVILRVISHQRGRNAATEALTNEERERLQDILHESKQDRG